MSNARVVFQQLQRRFSTSNRFNFRHHQHDEERTSTFPAFPSLRSAQHGSVCQPSRAVRGLLRGRSRDTRNLSTPVGLPALRHIFAGSKIRQANSILDLLTPYIVGNRRSLLINININRLTNKDGGEGWITALVYPCACACTYVDVHGLDASTRTRHTWPEIPAPILVCTVDAFVPDVILTDRVIIGILPGGF